MYWAANNSWGDFMRNATMAACAAMTLVTGFADAAIAQSKKKAVPQATVNSYKECCDRANARYYVANGKGTCLMMNEQQQDALYQCTNQRGIRVISGGQIGI
jgi:hypothetical protein